jgi:hypothetical protein
MSTESDSKQKPPFDDAPPELRRLAFFLNDFYKESDRGAALMAASIIDEVLCEVLSALLVSSSRSDKLLKGFAAPLGTFSARILAGFSLGLIDDQEFHEIEALRKIRNTFGHSWDSITLESPEVSAQVNKLPFPGHAPRERLNATVANLLGDLLWRERLVARERRETRSWPNKSGFGRALPSTEREPS